MLRCSPVSLRSWRSVTRRAHRPEPVDVGSGLWQIGADWIRLDQDTDTYIGYVHGSPVVYANTLDQAVGLLRMRGKRKQSHG